jgi:hypothetical protein
LLGSGVRQVDSWLDEAWVEYLWILAGFPYLLIIYKIRLIIGVRKDYSYFIDNLNFKIVIPSSLKFCSFVVIGSILFLSLHDTVQLNIVFFLLSLTSTAIESIWIIGRAHYLPGYNPHITCEECRINRHNNCSNVRSLERINELVRKGGKIFTPVCCCGFVLVRKKLELRLANL